VETSLKWAILGKSRSIIECGMVICELRHGT
jgi:hypothetical protein